MILVACLPPSFVNVVGETPSCFVRQCFLPLFLCLLALLLLKRNFLSNFLDKKRMTTRIYIYERERDATYNKKEKLVTLFIFFFNLLFTGIIFLPTTKQSTILRSVKFYVFRLYLYHIFFREKFCCIHVCNLRYIEGYVVAKFLLELIYINWHVTMSVIGGFF